MTDSANSSNHHPASSLRVAVAQIPNRVGDLAGNVQRIGEAMDWAEEEAHADVLVLPELALTGYGLGDLVLHREFIADAAESLARLAKRSGRCTTVLSTTDRVPPRRSWDVRVRDVAIGAALLSGGEVRGVYHKMLLPLYDLFDEARNFAPGSNPDLLWRIGDVVAGVSICEDMWSDDGPPEAQAAAGAQILLVPNASPFHRGKAQSRFDNTRLVARRNGVPIVYVNFAGAQDELVFDGGSIVVDAQGELLARGLEFAEDRIVVDVPVPPARVLRRDPVNVHTRPILRSGWETPASTRRPLDEHEAVWQALITSLRHWIDQNARDGVVVGLSGGIDSAVTAVLAVDALGPERVMGLSMPSPNDPAEEAADAHVLASNLGIEVEHRDMPELPSIDDDRPERRERRYARARAAALLDVLEERGLLVLATGNKTEISVGEPALFGDLAGYFAPLRDCSKTLLYELAQRRQDEDHVFPEGTLTRPTTTQRLSPLGAFSYGVLDDIVQRYVEQGEDLEDLVAAGHDPDAAEEILRRIDAAEIVRRYAPPGPKVTSRAFDQDRHMPIANAWRAHRRGDRARP